MIPIIIDTDPGIDDAIALALAIKCENLDIKLVSTVSGNVGIENTTRNALDLLEYFGRPDIKVAKGSSRPLISEFVDGSSYHGFGGLGNVKLPESKNKAIENAIFQMKETILNNKEKISIVALGPLTNISLLLKVYPEVKNNISNIVLMGGALARGNMSPLVEFNIGADPEAAKIVFNSDIPLAMLGLEMADNARINEDDLKNIDNKIGKFCYKILSDYKGGKEGKMASIYDATAIAYISNPSLFEVKKVFVDIETKGEYTRGASIVDLNGVYGKKANTIVAVKIYENKFRKWLIEKLSGI